MVGSESGDVLRAKYLDWCSAKIAERFLALTPDEIYQLAERATHGQAFNARPLASLSFFGSDSTAIATLGADEASSFRTLVARVTEVLADEMELPTLEEWSAAYSEAPEDFDKDLLGYWKE